MNIHQITLQGYTASVVPSTDPTSNCVSGLYLGTAGSYGVEQLDVTQSTGWENLSVTAIFQPCGVKITVPAEGGTIDVPWEATADMLTYPQGRIVFQGYADGELVNSCDLPYTVSGHSATTGTDPQPPTPDQYQQFVQGVQASADAAANSATAAAGSASAAAGSASAAAGSAQQAAETLRQVQEAGQQATEAIGTAQTNAVQVVGGAQSAAVQAVQSAQSDGVQAVQDQQQMSVGAVQAAGTEAVGQVTQTGQQQVQAVKDEGAAQTDTVAEAGSAQVQAVQEAGGQQITDIGEAGAQQVQAVNTAGDNKLDQINTAIAHPPQPNTSTGFWQVWNAETGQYEDTTALYQGGYYTPSVAADGTLTWTGSQSGMPELPSTNISGPQGLGVPTPSASNIGQVPTVNTAGDGYLLTGPYAPLEASIRPTANGNQAVCEDSITWAFQGLKVYGKSTQVGMPSPENPIPIVSAGDDGEIGLQITGKNLLDQTKLDLRQYNIYYGSEYSDLQVNLIAGINYTLSIPDDVVTLPDGIYFYNSVDNSSLAERYNSRSVSFKPDKNIAVKLDAYWAKGRPENATKLQLEVGSTATPYEPYKSQSLTISTPTGLPGIPVNYGGNYTDASGRQRVCDVKDYGTGKYTQMVGHIESYNSENITTPYMSTTGQLSTGAGVYYVLDEPVVTDISADELTAYRALVTYPGTTVVSTAEPVAGIEAQYIMDGTAAWNKICAALAQINAATTQTSQVVNTMLGAE